VVDWVCPLRNADKFFGSPRSLENYCLEWSWTSSDARADVLVVFRSGGGDGRQVRTGNRANIQTARALKYVIETDDPHDPA